MLGRTGMDKVMDIGMSTRHNKFIHSRLCRYSYISVKKKKTSDTIITNI